MPTVKAARVAETFDGVVAPANPASITANAGIITVPSFAGGSAPNALALTLTAGVERYAYLNAAGAADGNNRIKFKFRAVGGHDGVVCGPIIAQTVAGAAGTYFFFYLEIGRSAISLFKRVGGVTTALVVNIVTGGTTFGNAGDFVHGETYEIEFYRTFDLNGKGWLTSFLRRLSDSKYYLGPAAQWYDGRSQWISVQDQSIPAAAANAGAFHYLYNALDTSNSDDWSFDDTYGFTWQTIGNSRDLGNIASNGSWCDIVGTALNTSINIRAVGRSQCADQMNILFSTPPHPTFFGDMVNDGVTAAYGNNATKRGFALNCHFAGLIYASCPIKQKGQAATSTTGAWVNNTLYDGVTTIRSNDPNATATFTATVDATGVAYFEYTGIDAPYGTGGDFTVHLGTAGGALLASASCATPGSTTTNYLNNSAINQVIRITGLTPGVVTLVGVKANDTNYVFFDGVTSPGMQGGVFNRCLVNNTGYMNAAGYAFYGSSDANIDAYNTGIAANVATGISDGLPLTPVLIRQILNTTTDLIDDIHYSNPAQTKVANAVIAAISGSAGNPGRLTLLGAG